MRDPDDPLWRRLLAELDRVEPRWSSPRYLTAKTRPVLWRLTPAGLAVAIGGIVALTAYAGSPNPAVWTQHVVTVVHQAQASPTPTPTPAQPVSNPTPSEPPEQHESPEPSQPPEQHESPEPTQSPEPHDSTEPSGEHSGSGSGSTDGGSTSD
jgi:outer membrane biosynthesis protein TonB